MRLNQPSNLVFFLLIAATVASGFVFIGTALTGLLLFVWGALAIGQAFARNHWPVYPLCGWMLAYLVWLAVGVWTSNAPNVSWLTAWMLAGFPVAFLAWGVTSDPAKTWRALRAVLLWVGPAFALWGLGQVITGYGSGQPVGPLVDKNAFAALMNLFWFMGSVHFIRTMRDRGLHWCMIPPGLGLLLIAMTLFAAESRGATLTWLLLMPIAMWAGYRNTHNKTAIMLVLAIALTGYLGVSNLLGLNVAQRPLNLEQDASTSARLQLWKSATQIALDHPITGTGWGTFAAQYPAYRDPLENTTAGKFVHNDYIQFAAEGGIPALILLLGILAGLLLQLRCSFASKQNPDTLEATGLLLGVLALFMQAGVNFIFYFAFMNILAGVLSARAVQLLHPAGVGQVIIGYPGQIGRATKLMMVSFTALLLTGPLLLHLLAQSTLSGSQPGLALLRTVWPEVNAYKIAKFISAVRPSSGIAQELMLQSGEAALKDSAGISMVGGNFQRELLQETLDRYEFVRGQTANSPAYGVREARALIHYRALLESGFALKRAREILTLNLRKDPFHVDSMIVLSRLDVLEGHPLQAQALLAAAMQHVLSRRDQQLLAVESLRQRAAPRQIVELDSIEKELKNVRSDSETGKALVLSADFSENIDRRLLEIAHTQGL